MYNGKTKPLFTQFRDCYIYNTIRIYVSTVGLKLPIWLWWEGSSDGEVNPLCTLFLWVSFESEK